MDDEASDGHGLYDYENEHDDVNGTEDGCEDEVGPTPWSRWTSNGSDRVRKQANLTMGRVLSSTCIV